MQLEAFAPVHWAAFKQKAGSPFADWIAVSLQKL